jgi:hypothetical protein
MKFKATSASNNGNNSLKINARTARHCLRFP